MLWVFFVLFCFVLPGRASAGTGRAVARAGGRSPAVRGRRRRAAATPAGPGDAAPPTPLRCTDRLQNHFNAANKRVFSWFTGFPLMNMILMKRSFIRFHSD